MKHHLYVVMGISSCGKSSVGQELAKVLGNSLVDGSVEYYEGDAYHPENNVEKMRNGLPLDDDNRKPWLLLLRHLIRDAYYSSSTCVLACSALKKAYRDMLQGDVSATEYVRFVWLDIHPNMAKERCRMRGSHFFPPSLIDSQYAILDMTEEECFCRIQIEPGLTVDDIVNITMDRILS